MDTPVYLNARATEGLQGWPVAQRMWERLSWEDTKLTAPVDLSERARE